MQSNIMQKKNFVKKFFIFSKKEPHISEAKVCLPTSTCHPKEACRQKNYRNFPFSVKQKIISPIIGDLFTHHRKSSGIRVLFLFRERMNFFKRTDNNCRAFIDAGLL
jgi:hypothetical protein